MKHFFIVLTVLIYVGTAKAQQLPDKRETAEDSVKAVINKMFTGMKAADPVRLQFC